MPVQIPKKDRPYIIDFATRSFRDYADQDYITARIAYRREFDQQFRWCALQAIEKYLKAILIYNFTSAKDLHHDLVDALDRVRNIPDLDFDLPAEDTEKFIEYISLYGADRYLSHPTHLTRTALLTLDKTVWCIRRYCFFMRETITVKGKRKDLFEYNKRYATNPYFEDQRHKFRLQRGYLEKVIDKRLPAYDDLVWKNFFYGRVKKHTIKNFRFRMSSANPTHALNPDVFNSLCKLVDFPKRVRNAYKSS